MEDIISVLKAFLNSGVFAVTVGFLLGQIPETIKNRAKQRKALAALHCEIEYCATLAKRYLDNNRDIKTLTGSETQLPLRYPILAFQNSFPSLLDSQNLKADANIIYELTDYYCHITALNNSLNLLESGHYNKRNNNIIYQTTKELAHKCSADHHDVRNLLNLLKHM